MDIEEKNRRLVVVSNRLPVKLNHSEGVWEGKPGSGGLVTALSPLLRHRGGLWVGWPGNREPAPLGAIRNLLGPLSEEWGFRLTPVILSEKDVDSHYYGFSNAILWPLFHGLQSRCCFENRFYRSFISVNDKFAKVLAKHTAPNDFIWIHDYQLIPLGERLSRLGLNRSTGFFLHIPFPSPDIFFKLPWREEILSAMMSYRLIGFQTPRDRRHFSECLRQLDRSTKQRGHGRIVELHSMGKRVLTGALPIGIDFREFSDMSKGPGSVERMGHLKKELGNRFLFLGVDRLDYTKGLPNKLRAFELMLRRTPSLREKVVLYQIVIPSREEISEYKELKTEIELLVSRINGEFATLDWTPVVYRYRPMERNDLVSLYSASDAIVVTSVQDGMNLVCKEYCASHWDNRGTVILSEFAGAARQFKDGALLINPYSDEQTADAMERAFSMDENEKRHRMSKLRRIVKRQDIFWWTDKFLKASYGTGLKDWPYRELPSITGIQQRN